jgi:uncharacterized protein (TIGR02594 family)
MDEPSWLSEGRDLLGLREIKGSAHEPKILALWEDAGLSYIKDDETAWCAAFVGGTLARAGVIGTRKPNARSYMVWGSDVFEGGPNGIPLGAIVVLSRPPSEWQGHVAYAVGHTRDGNIALLGGNQGDAVSIAKFQPGRVIAARWPTPASRQTLRQLPLLDMAGQTSSREA